MNITGAQLDILERALTLQDTWDKALKVIEEIKANVAEPALIKVAQDEYVNDNVEVDDDAGTSSNDEGSWVQAWVYVNRPQCECQWEPVSRGVCEVCKGEDLPWDHKSE